MEILCLEHDDLDQPFRIADLARARGQRLRRVRLHRGESVPARFAGVAAVISLGGSPNVDQKAEFPWIVLEQRFLREAHERGVPVFAVCLGAQLLAEALGGSVGLLAGLPEIGMHELRLTPAGAADPVLGALPARSVAMHCHGYEVKRLPPGAARLAGSEITQVQAYRVGGTTLGVQFHPEWDRAEVDAVMEDSAAWADAAGLDVIALREGVERWFGEYRRAGDALLGRVLDGLFARR